MAAPQRASLAAAFPGSDRLLVAGIVNYVYKRPCDPDEASRSLQAPPVLPIRAKAQWLACTDKVCVPERGEFSLDFPVGTGGTTEQARFDEWRRAAAPARQPGESDDRRPIEIAVPLPASVAVDEPYYFPADDGPIDYAAPQGFAARATC